MPANPRVFFDIRIGGETIGRMEFELFADSCPRTAENFRCFCTGEMGKSKTTGKHLFYKNTVIHRVIKGFMAQGGDYENADGTGGESIYGKNFGDENFQHKHIGPGMLSMANAGKNTNGSQFFITFKTTSHLNGKHVVFGRLCTGIDVLKRIEMVATGREDRPNQEVLVYNTGQVGKAPIPLDMMKDSAATTAAANDEEIDLEEPAEEEQEPEKPADFEQMSDKQKKLFELRLKVNKARKDNKREVAEEHQRLNSKKNPDSRRKDFMERKAAWEEDIKQRGEEGDEPWMHETAESFGYREKKAKSKKAAPFGWEVFNQDSLYNAHKKRLEETRKNEDLTVREVNDLAYFEAHEPSAADKERMAAELRATQERRGKFSRRRPHYEDKDVDSINDRNEVFNRKVKRDYDKYTAEIKANLERGTA
jgi:cyclophilin family peptidyl-prolyl cis-trans isomerase